MVCQVGLEPTIQVARGLKPRVYTHSTTSTYGGSAQGRTADCSVMSQVFYQLNYRTIFIVQQDSLLSCPFSYELLYVTIKIRPTFSTFGSLEPTTRFCWAISYTLIGYTLVSLIAALLRYAVEHSCCYTIGTDGWGRTSSLEIRSFLLYPIGLHPHFSLVGFSLRLSLSS